MFKKIIFCSVISALLILNSSAAAEDQSSVSPLGFSQTNCPVGFIKGISWGWVGLKGEYLGDEPADSMKKLAQTGANWVCISFAGEMMEPDDVNIIWGDNDPCMVTNNEIINAVKLARNNNLKIILKPVVNCRDGTWRGYIDFPLANAHKNPNPNAKVEISDINQWNQWFDNFQKFLLHYAAIAEQTKCDMLCLGCEMSTTERFSTKWRNLITEVRKIYHGPITYNANHGNEEKVPWWDAVDIIGMSGYYPVGADINKPYDDPCKAPNDSSIEGMKKRWFTPKMKLKYVSRKFDRPVFFIEIGVCSAKGNTNIPWQHPDSNSTYDGDEQARFYKAATETFSDEPWFWGFVWWDWPAHLYPADEGKTNTSFCPYGKPAEQLLKEQFARQR